MTTLPTMKFEVPPSMISCEKDMPFTSFRSTYRNAPSNAILKIHVADTCSSRLVEQANRYWDADSARLERCNDYFENIVKIRGIHSRAKRMQYITLDGLNLDKWGTLLQTLHHFGNRCVEELELIGRCDLSDEGARFLGSVLGHAKLLPSFSDGTPTSESSSKIMGQPLHFDIKGLKIHDTRGSMKWISGFVQNQTLIRLDLKSVPALYSAFQFIENSPRLKSVEFKHLHEEKTKETEEDEETDEESEDHESAGEIEKEEIIRNINRDEPMDLETLNIALRWYDEQHLSKSIGNILSRADHLKKMKLDECSSMGKIENFQALCSPLAENKGPKHLRLLFAMDLKVVGTMLVSSLVGNEKIEKLELVINDFGKNIELEQELVNVLGKMPRLQSWDIKVDKQSVPLLNPLGPRRGRLWFREQVEQWEEWISSQIRSNWNLREIDPPFELSDEAKEMLNFNKWRKLFYHHDQMSCGIWSLALSQIKTVDLMFRVIQEIPSLFQQVADATNHEGGTKNHHSANQLPTFVVPHHPNCPGCHKRIKYQEKLIG